MWLKMQVENKIFDNTDVPTVNGIYSAVQQFVLD